MKKVSSCTIISNLNHPLISKRLKILIRRYPRRVVSCMYHILKYNRYYYIDICINEYLHKFSYNLLQRRICWAICAMCTMRFPILNWIPTTMRIFDEFLMKLLSIVANFPILDVILMKRRMMNDDERWMTNDDEWLQYCVLLFV